MSVTVHHQRMEALSLDRRYPSIFLAGPTFNLLADSETALRALRSIHAHLTDVGAALIPLWIPRPTPAGELGTSRSATDDAGIELTYTPLSESYDLQGRTRTTACQYERTVGAATEAAQREWIVHWHTAASFEQLCDAAGLVVLTLTDDTTNAAPDASTLSFTATVRRGSPDDGTAVLLTQPRQPLRWPATCGVNVGAVVEVDDGHSPFVVLDAVEHPEVSAVRGVQARAGPGSARDRRGARPP